MAKRAFWGCFAKTGSINSGTDIIADMPCAIQYFVRALYFVRPLYFVGETPAAASHIRTTHHIVFINRAHGSTQAANFGFLNDFVAQAFFFKQTNIYKKHKKVTVIIW